MEVSRSDCATFWGPLAPYKNMNHLDIPRHTSLNVEKGGGRGVFLPFHFPREEFLNEFWSRSIRSPRLEAFFDRLSDIRRSEILRGNGEWVNLLRDSRFVLCIFKCIFVVLSMIPLFEDIPPRVLFRYSFHQNGNTHFSSSNLISFHFIFASLHLNYLWLDYTRLYLDPSCSIPRFFENGFYIVDIINTFCKLHANE